MQSCFDLSIVFWKFLWIPSNIHRTAREGLKVKNISINYWLFQGGLPSIFFLLSNIHRTARKMLAIKILQEINDYSREGLPSILSIYLIFIGPQGRGLRSKNIAINYWLFQGGITFNIFHTSNTHRTAREGLAVKNIARNYWLL